MLKKIILIDNDIDNDNDDDKLQYLQKSLIFQKYK